MHPLEHLRLAWRSIRGHRLRSALTTLGIVIGVAAVIAFVTLGASLQAGVIGDLSPDEGNTLYGWAAESGTEGGPLAGAQPVFTQDDLDAVSDLESVAAAYGYAVVPTQAVSDGTEEVAVGQGVITTGPSYVDASDLRAGRQFEHGEREAVLNPAAAGQFEENVSVGDDLEITLLGGGRTTATVVGITEESTGQSPFEGFDASPRVYVPTEPYYDETIGGFGAEPASDGSATADDGDEVRFQAIVVEPESADEDAVDAARTAAVEYLESDAADAGERLGEDERVVLETSAELLEQLRDVLEVLQNFVVGIAAISLLVGSIGIANIMLVSVTERTREIGIMKAVGAQNRDVLGLFLAEAVVLGMLGAVLGTALGLFAGYLGTRYVDLPLVYPLEYVALAIAVGVVVGVLAGLYPAWRAARTDPIDALRYE